MKAFRTRQDGIAGARFDGTLAEAHTRARQLTPRSSVRVELIDVRIDEAGVLALLNGTAVSPVERVWALTVRGALQEVLSFE